MSKKPQVERSQLRETLIGNLSLLAFGCFALAFLVSIDRVEWFSIKPATGTSVAMANAANHANAPAPDQTEGADIAQ